MQKRMRALDQSQGDPMFACYAQMKFVRYYTVTMFSLTLVKDLLASRPLDTAIPRRFCCNRNSRCTLCVGEVYRRQDILAPLRICVHPFHGDCIETGGPRFIMGNETRRAQR